MADLKPTFIDPDNPSQLREPRAGDNFINEPDVSFDTISDLTDYKIDQSPRTKTANVMGYYSAGDGGGGTFYWDSSEDKANHNGGTVINPDHLSTIGSDNWYSASGDSTDTTGSGCWVRNVGEYVTPEMYGAKGDGDTSSPTKDTEAFQQMLSDYGNIRLTKHYFLDAISGRRDSYNIIGNGEAKLDFSDVQDETHSEFADLLLEGSEDDLPSLSSDVSKDDKSITFSSDHNLSAGDLFYIYNPTDSSFSPYRDYYHAGEICRVKEVASSTTVDLYDPLFADYTAASVDLYKINPVNVSMENYEIIGNDRYGVWIGRGEDIKVNKVGFKGVFKNTLTLGMCYGREMSNINVNHTAGASLYSYGIKYGSSQKINIRDSYVDTYGDSVESGASQSFVNRFTSREITIDNVYASTTLSAHGDVEHVKFIDSYTERLLLTGDHCIARGNTVKGYLGIREAIGNNFKIHDNNFLDAVESGSAYGEDIRIVNDFGVEPITRGGDFIITDNQVKGDVRLSLHGDHGFDINLTVKGNEISKYRDSSGEIRINGRGGKFNNLIVEDNKVRGAANVNGYYSDYALRLDEVNCRFLSVKNNKVWGRFNINYSAIDSPLDVFVEDNVNLKSTIAMYVFGNENVNSNVFFNNNKVIDCDRSDGGSSATNTNVYFRYITNVFIENNTLGDTVHNDNGDWVGLNGTENVYFSNNNPLNQEDSGVTFNSGTTSDVIKKSKTGLGLPSHGVATIESGTNNVTVDFDTHDVNKHTILVEGIDDEVRGNVEIVNSNANSFEIATIDRNSVTADREVVWRLLI